MILSPGNSIDMCTGEDQKVLESIVRNPYEIIKCGKICQGDPSLRCVAKCFGKIMDRKLTPKCSKCFGEVFSCGVKRCDKCRVVVDEFGNDLCHACMLERCREKAMVCFKSTGPMLGLLV